MAFVVCAKGLLETGKYVHASRDRKGHAAKFTKQLVPLLDGDAAAEQIEQLLDTFQAVRR
jgi:hypothetical protein